MMPEAVDYLDKARECLAAARSIAGLPLPAVAAREAYLAAFHAAEAFVFARIGRAVKTHRGLRATFARLAKDEPGLDPAFVRVLADAYEFKAIADYAVGDTARPITAANANRMIETAAGLVEAVAKILSADGR
jgi:uncharacterized protein (UPF0332 family)